MTKLQAKITALFGTLAMLIFGTTLEGPGRILTLVVGAFFILVHLASALVEGKKGLDSAAKEKAAWDLSTSRLFNAFLGVLFCCFGYQMAGEGMLYRGPVVSACGVIMLLVVLDLMGKAAKPVEAA